MTFPTRLCATVPSAAMLLSGEVAHANAYALVGPMSIGPMSGPGGAAGSAHALLADALGAHQSSPVTWWPLPEALPDLVAAIARLRALLPELSYVLLWISSAQIDVPSLERSPFISRFLSQSSSRAG